jgi:cell fate regulator YaaT (PSP1 superfamily)
MHYALRILHFHKEYKMEDEIIIPEAEQTPTHAEVVDIQFRPGQKIYFFDPDGVEFAAGDHVIIDTARGAEFGYVTGGNHRIPMKDVVAPLRKVIRKANSQDEKIHGENQVKEARAYEICLQKIESHGLDMQLVSAEYAFDGSKILFYFTADERVDFRELVKNLASIFHTRIELRQIGVRDKAKMVGGLGICGRPFCCATFLDDFQPVSIKMAKTQNLSLNPTKISGTCGRLMCCLKYEQDAYEDLIRNAPKMDSFVDTPEGRGTVTDVDLLRQRVKVRMEESQETLTWFANADIAVLRSGKAKKNDPPIPADLAPISGSGKRIRREIEEEKIFLDPIKFRYSTEAVVEEPEEIPEELPEVKETKPRRSRHGKKAEKPEQAEKKADAPKPEKKERREKAPKEPREPKEPQESPETAEASEAKKSHRRRPNYRRYKKNKPHSEG